jgi:cyanate lyase
MAMMISTLRQKVRQPIRRSDARRGRSDPPTDPLIYRFHELVMVNGPACRALTGEEFGDGICPPSTLNMQMPAEPEGRPGKITMSGKFLPCK